MGALIFGNGEFTQANRPIRIESPLGKDVLLLREFVGQEAFSQVFNFSVDLLSYRDDIQAQEIIGESITIVVNASSLLPRYFNGIIASFEFTGMEKRGVYGYRAEIVPWLWFLGKSSNCRVFQNQPVTAIVETVFSDLGFTDFNMSGLYNEYPEIEYCVQYRETDLNFVSRLLEREGIFYFFSHEKDKHTLILADSNSAYTFLDKKTVEHNSGSPGGDFINHWRHRYQFVSGKWGQTDFNYEKFDHSLATESTAMVNLKNSANYEQYDYPGSYKESERGRVLTKLRMEQEENSHNTIVGKSNISDFTLGKKFTFHSDEWVADRKQNFALMAIKHQATENSYLADAKPEDAYHNEFQCLPEAATFRPPLRSHKPSIDGVQTAVVVGKSGDEIYTDQYGRIKLQFHWDRLGSKDEKSSCWVRVASQWAGKKWGTIGIPRVGQEVVVTFINGDPDQPLVIGSVYNSAHMPPYSLPGSKTQTGLKSYSSKGGGNYNEISIDDKKGAEALTLHAAKDFNTNVKNNLSSSTKGNATTSVDGNASESVGGDHSVSVTGNQTVSVTGNQTASVSGNHSGDVSGNHSSSVGGNHAVTVSGNQTDSVSGDQTVSSTNQTHNVSAKQTVNASDQSFIIGAHQEVSSASQTFTVTGKQAFNAGIQEFIVGGKASINAAEIDLTATGKITLNVGGSSITIDGGKIELVLGASSVKLDAAGVTVMGPIIKLN